ncbi:YciI family protein [Dermatobacter hominis]|uniref:YciI family protein n=1 Tax=Dermatobacter hominis TaxID=2884263 RepID=UPI001D10184F|nr:YciI family protein [Dermatobacter hominis]UDY35094.1 YciI family protein [Dermatobacter hominis]
MDREDGMKYVVIGTSAGRSMDEIMAVYPRHEVVVRELIDRGEVIGIGPFLDGGNMAVFRSEAAAEEFVARDPFRLEGLVESYEIRQWADELLS